MHNAKHTTVSKPQRRLFDLTRSLFSQVILEFPVGRYHLDIALPTLGINIEYDGSYWHRNRARQDKKRDRYLRKYNWTVIRFLDRVPSETTLLLAMQIATKQSSINTWVNIVVKPDIPYHIGVCT